MQLALCLEYLHNQNILYRDLKLENVLLDSNGYINLIDFGMSCRIPKGCPQQDLPRGLNGTPEYMAPEILLDQGHSYPVDFWTLGIAAYEMMVGFTPFYSGVHDKKHKKMKESIQKKEVSFPENKKHGFQLSADAEDFIKKLLIKDPALRLGSKKGTYELF